MHKRFEADKALELAQKLTSGQRTHDYPLTCEELSKLDRELSPPKETEEPAYGK